MQKSSEKPGGRLLRTTSRGGLSLPASLRKGAELFRAVRRSDGVIELHPQATVDESQTWFWTERWQAMEREAEGDMEKGRVYAFNTGVDLVTALKNRSGRR